MFVATTYLCHHGILGQKWGKKNGPPYPLDASDHSKSEQRAGWKKSLSESGRSGGRKSYTGLTSGQKRAILIGAGVAAAGIAAYGAYKCGALDGSIINSGKEAINSSSDEWTRKLQDMLKQQYSDLNNTAKDGKSASAVAKEAAEAIKNAASNVPKFGEPRRINESIQDSLIKANPLFGTERGTNNCVPSSIAGIMRTLGYDVEAKDTGGKQLNPGGVLEECFKDIKVLDGSAKKFGISKKDASEVLIKRFGNDASGICSVGNKNRKGEGHAFSWIISNGKVSFYDFQRGYRDEAVSKYWGSFIDSDGPLTLARLDNVVPNFDALRKYVDF